MNFEHVPQDQSNFTGLKGYVRTTYNELVKAFGEPLRLGDDKVRVEWVLRFADGTLATIYDWKERQPVEQVTDWHVGGHKRIALDRVADVLGEVEADYLEL